MRVNGSMGQSTTFKEGLPQGFVLPHLFTVYINDLLAEFEDTFVSAYADDLLIDDLLCVACMNIQLQPEHLGSQLPPPENVRKFSWRQPEPSPALSALTQ